MADEPQKFIGQSRFSRSFCNFFSFSSFRPTDAKAVHYLFMESLNEAAPTQNVGTRLLFENDRVRVWDLALQPGEFLEKHVHRDDFLFVVTDGGSLRHVDPNDSSNDRAVKYDDGLVVFHEAGEGIVHNRLVNVGDALYRNIVIELKDAK